MISIQKSRRKRRSPEFRRNPMLGVHFATEEEGRRLFEHQAQKELGISGEAFLARWDAGEYRCIADPILARNVERLSMLIPFARREQR